MTADILNNEKLNSVINELFIRDRKLNISLVLLNNIISLFPKVLD